MKNIYTNVRCLSFFLPLLVFLNYLQPCLAQTGVKIAATAGPADASAILDLTSSNKGLLFPRVALVSLTNNTTPVNNPATGLVVYNLGTGGVAATGIYYWDGSSWVLLSSGGLSGSGTANQVAKFTASNAIGNSVITDDGTNVGIGVAIPTQKLVVGGNAQINGLGGTGTRSVVADANGLLKANNSTMLVNITSFKDATRRGLGTSIPGSIVLETITVNKKSTSSILVIRGVLSCFNGYSGGSAIGIKYGAGTEQFVGTSTYIPSYGAAIPVQCVISGHTTIGSQSLVIRVTGPYSPCQILNPNSADYGGYVNQTSSDFIVEEIEP